MKSVDVKKSLKAVGYRVASAFAFKPEDWTRRDVVRALAAIALFLSSLGAAGRWWLWKHGKVELGGPILWTLVSLSILLITPGRPVVLAGALAIYAFYGLKSAILNGLPEGLLMAVIASGLVVLIMLASPSSFAEYGSGGWGIRFKKEK